MNYNIKKFFVFIWVVWFSIIKLSAQSCWTDGTPATAAFATGGTGNFKDKILWLTWGTKLQSEVTQHPYGKNLVRIVNGDVSRARIDMGNGRFLCIEAKISNIEGLAITDTSTGSGQILNGETTVGVGWQLNSYRSGGYFEDGFDDMYNIGGSNANNRLVAGIRNSRVGSKITFQITCTATLDGVPVRLPGMVLADAESMAPYGPDDTPYEYISAKGMGVWNVIDMKKDLTSSGTYNGVYNVRKTPETVGYSTLRFGQGNGPSAAVAALLFNADAYGSEANKYAVTFDVTLKGGGGTALALGLLRPAIDGGDAPTSYGSPLHIIDDFKPVSDGLSNNTIYNINTSTFNPGGFVSSNVGYLGTVFPDGFGGVLSGKDALGDDNSGPGGPNEEDAWPVGLRSFSYKKHYKVNDIITAVIPYKPEMGKSGYIYGWIDFNRNGKFDADEVASAIATPTGNSVNLVWTVPSKRRIGSTYVRLRYVYDRPSIITSTSELEQLASSLVVTNGEIEDRRILIQGPVIVNPVINSDGKIK